MHLIVDSTGLAVVGDGEWAAAKTRTTLHTRLEETPSGVDRSGVIAAQVLTEGHAGGATMAISLVAAVGGDLAGVTADAAYDTIAIYDAAETRGATVVVLPPRGRRAYLDGDHGRSGQLARTSRYAASLRDGKSAICGFPETRRGATLGALLQIRCKI